MADPVVAPAGGLGDEDEDTTATSQEEISLDEETSQLFREAGEQDEAEAALAAPATAPTAPTVAQDPRYDKLESDYQSLREQNIELNTRMEMILMRQEEASKPPSADDDEVDLDDFNAQLTANPGQAIVGLLQKMLPKVVRQAETGATKAAVGVTQYSQAWQADRNRAEADYGSIYNKDAVFTERANQIFNQLTADAPVVNGGRYRPGAMHQAMSIAYGQLIREGKLAAKATPITERRKSPPDLGLPAGTNIAEKGKDFLSEFNQREISIMQRQAQRMGVPFDKFVSRMQNLRAKDSGYGRR